MGFSLIVGVVCSWGRRGPPHRSGQPYRIAQHQLGWQGDVDAFGLLVELLHKQRDGGFDHRRGRLANCLDRPSSTTE